MTDRNWKDSLDPVLRGHLEHQLKEVTTQKNAYLNAPNAHTAQLWTSVAVLSKQVFSLNARLKQMETLLESIIQKDKPTKKAATKKAVTKKKTTRRTKKKVTKK